MWCADKKPVWAWIECTSINGGTKPTTAQVKAEVWMALIHGARGFGYFCHQFSPTFVEAAWLADATMKVAITAINQRVTALAPALNSPNVTGAVTVTSGNTAVPIDILVKNSAGSEYLFAVAMRNDTATARFSCAGLTVKDSVGVLDENRKLAVVNNVFTDHFSGYGVHLYKIDLPSGTALRRGGEQNNRPSIDVRLSLGKGVILVSRGMADDQAGALDCRVISSSGRNYARFSLAPEASMALRTGMMPAGMYLITMSGTNVRNSKWFIVNK
jgi:hypothetical protein